MPPPASDSPLTQDKLPPDPGPSSGPSAASPSLSSSNQGENSSGAVSSPENEHGPATPAPSAAPDAPPAPPFVPPPAAPDPEPPDPPTPAAVDPPSSPRRSSVRQRKPVKKLTYDDAFKQVTVLCYTVLSMSTYAIPSTTDASVIAMATTDWQSVHTEPQFEIFDDLFSSQLDPETLQLYDVERAFHPFAFSAKLQSQDFPNYGEILRMPEEERLKWMEAMDIELSELSDRGAFEFVPRTEPLEKEKPITKSLWTFRRKRRPDGTVSRYKARLVVRGDLQRDTSK